MRATGPTGAIRVIAGKSDDVMTCRFGLTDFIEVRIPNGDSTYIYALAQLPRTATASPVAEGAEVIYDDLNLPPVGTPLYAKPAANSGIGRGFLIIDISTLRPIAPVV